MSKEPDPPGLLERTGAEEMLSGELDSLPEAIGRPVSIPPSHTRARVVAVGATLTGVTLVLGIALIALGAVQGFSGGFGGLALAAVVLGAVLVTTHWGWVHVAELTGNVLEGRRNAEVDGVRHLWLDAIEPYTRYEVSTDVESDGSITIATVRHRPVPVGERHFKFLREVLEPERHSAETPAAEITERAEQLRREAALQTERERARFQSALDAHQQVLLNHHDDQERLEARRAAAEALSHQINSNLRDPPLTE